MEKIPILLQKMPLRIRFCPCGGRIPGYRPYGSATAQLSLLISKVDKPDKGRADYNDGFGYLDSIGWDV